MNDQEQAIGTLVFVYGTLKRGQGNHRYLRGQEFIGTGVTDSDQFQMHHNGAFPMVTKSADGGRRVTGELWRVDDKGLRGVDALEGNGSFYRRERVPVTCDNYTGEAWIYIYLGSPCRLAIANTNDLGWVWK